MGVAMVTPEGTPMDVVSGGPAISASVVTQTATANRAQVEWMGVTDAADGGAMVAYDGSLEEMLDAVESSVRYTDSRIDVVG